MGETDRTDVLRRKARSGREEHQARVMSPSRALRLALARAADDLFELDLTVNAIGLEGVTQAEAVGAFGDDDLLMVLDGPDGAVGAASVEVSILAGLIEMQTMGCVLSSRPEPRTPTQTDAAMVAPLLDASLAGLSENLEMEPAAQWVDGMRFGARVESVRMLTLLLEATDFQLFRLRIALGDGAKEGSVLIALPVPLPPPPEGQGEDPDATHVGRINLGQGALLTAEAPLTAVLHRLRMPLAEISKLQPGDRLEIPRAALAETQLETGTKSIAHSCTLGQMNGFRAVRLTASGESIGTAGAPEAWEGEDDQPVSMTFTVAEDAPIEGTASKKAAGQVRMVSEANPSATVRAHETLQTPQKTGDKKTGDDGLSNPKSDDLSDFEAGFGDLPDLGDLGDLADLPELTLDD